MGAELGVEFALLIYVVISSIYKFILPICGVHEPIFLLGYFNSPKSMDLIAITGVLFIAGYLRIFFGIHFLEYDESAEDPKKRFIEQVDTTNRIEREEMVLRPLLYLSTLMMFWFLGLGEDYKYWFCIFGALQIIVMLRYQVLFWDILFSTESIYPAQTKDPDRDKNVMIQVVDYIYFLLIIYLIVLILPFSRITNDINHMWFEFFAVCFVFGFFLEIVIHYKYALIRAFKAYCNYWKELKDGALAKDLINDRKIRNQRFIDQTNCSEIIEQIRDLVSK